MSLPPYRIKRSCVTFKGAEIKCFLSLQDDVSPAPPLGIYVPDAMNCAQLLQTHLVLFHVQACEHSALCRQFLPTPLPATLIRTSPRPPKPSLRTHSPERLHWGPWYMLTQHLVLTLALPVYLSHHKVSDLQGKRCHLLLSPSQSLAPGALQTLRKYLIMSGRVKKASGPEPDSTPVLFTTWSHSPRAGSPTQLGF